MDQIPYSNEGSGPKQVCKYLPNATNFLYFIKSTNLILTNFGRHSQKIFHFFKMRIENPVLFAEKARGPATVWQVRDKFFFKKAKNPL